ncbi:MAG: 4Fe-4S binding protein, partial [Halobacteriota archaeon]
LITNAVAHALKAGIPVFVLPVDIEGRVISPVPYFINRDLCIQCRECSQACPNDAIDEQIDYLRCNGCGVCKEVCLTDAIIGGSVNLMVREIDKNNVKALRKQRGLTVLNEPTELKDALWAMV